MEQKTIATVMKKFNLLRKHIYFLEFTFEEMVHVLRELEDQIESLQQEIADLKGKNA